MPTDETPAQLKLEAAGFTVAHVDLRIRHRADTDALADLLGAADVLWVGGGNTFWLAHQVHASGLGAVLSDRLDAGLVHAGQSAGAVLCAPTLAGVDREDDPTMSPDPTAPGLGLVNFLPWAHWRPSRPHHTTRHAPLPKVTTPVYRIRDEEYLLVRDGHVELRRTRPGAPDRTPDAELALW